MSRDAREPVIGVSDQAWHKLSYTATDDGWRIEILNLNGRGIVLFTQISCTVSAHSNNEDVVCS